MFIDFRVHKSGGLQRKSQLITSHPRDSSEVASYWPCHQPAPGFLVLVALLSNNLLVWGMRPASTHAPGRQALHWQSISFLYNQVVVVFHLHRVAVMYGNRVTFKRNCGVGGMVNAKLGGAAGWRGSGTLCPFWGNASIGSLGQPVPVSNVPWEFTFVLPLRNRVCGSSGVATNT